MFNPAGLALMVWTCNANDLQPSLSNRPGLCRMEPNCDDPSGAPAILAYRNECNYMKSTTNNNNRGTARDMGDQQNDPMGIDTTQVGGFGQQGWLSTDQSIHVLTPTSGTLFDKTGSANAHMTGFGDGGVDGQERPGSPDGQS